MSDRSLLFYGPNGTGKTRAALEGATEDEPVSLHEFEPGGFRRASPGLGEAKKWITVHKYRVPSEEMEQLGEIKVTGGGNALPQLSYKLEGWSELVAEFNRNMVEGCKAGLRPVIDTATRLWLAQRQAFEQQVQEATGSAAEKLGQLKYTAPNARMLSAAEYGAKFNLDTVLIAHEGTVFNSNPPIYIPDTMKELANLVDVVLRFRLRDNVPVATFEKGAEAGLIRGRELEYPTLGKVSAILDAAALVRDAGMKVPETDEELFKIAGMLDG